MDLIGAPWLILLAYWAISAFRVRPTQQAEPAASRLAVLAIVVAAFTILFGPWLRSSVLGERFVPDVPEIRYMGIVLIWGGIGFAIWARYHLGEYWSARITIKVDHKLIDSGPYAYIRHPIYSGILLALIGTALAVGNWRGVIAFFLILAVYVLKARREESLLTRELGETYQEYKNRTGMLIPRWKMASHQAA
jgi:protein-S-isoprenylcysteine O-methyltransferase Ste14